MNWIDRRLWSEHGPEYRTLEGEIYFWCPSCQKWHRDHDLETAERGLEPND